MAKKIEPGVKCRVIGSARGPSGASVGKIVKVVDRADPPMHVMWGEMWDVEAIDGSMFQVQITSPDMQIKSIRESRNATCAADWLQPLDDDQMPPKVQEKERELIE